MGFKNHDLKNSSKNLGRDVLTNRMLTGSTHTVVLKGNEAGSQHFESGKVLQEETVHVVCDTSKGIEFDSTNDLIKVKVGVNNGSTPLKVVNAFGETATFSNNCFLKGTKVVLESNEFPQYNGTYTLDSAELDSNDCMLHLVADAPNTFFGDADINTLANLTATKDADAVRCTVLPFPPAFSVEMLGLDGQDAGTDAARQTPVNFRMSNSSGTSLLLDYPDGQVVYGEITKFSPQNDANSFAILYLQDKPSLEFSPYNKVSGSIPAGGRGGPKSR